MRLTSPYEPPSLTLPPWVPPPGGLRTWGCGEHFDAVRNPGNPRTSAVAVLQAAGGHGPVLTDPYSGSWHILLDPDTVRPGPWARPRNTPSAARHPPHDPRRPGHRRYRPALAHPARHRLHPRRVAQRRPHRCVRPHQHSAPRCPASQDKDQPVTNNATSAPGALLGPRQALIPQGVPCTAPHLRT